MIVWVLVILFNGTGNSQATVTVPGIASQQECERLADAVGQRLAWPSPRCYPYRAGK